MYLLELNHGGGEIHRYFLLPGREYTIGRKECDILLPLGEPSISRHHATIKVAPMPRYAALDAKSELEISLFDHSKHGTFVDRERVGKDISRFIYPEDHIRFGMRVTGKVIPVAFVLAISPALPDAVLDVVVDAAVQIGAHVLEDRVPAPQEFYDRHVNCLGFLFVSEDKFAMDTPMMESLGYGYTLVTPSYLRTLAGELAANFALPPTDFPLPVSPVPGSLALRSTNYRRPAQTFFAFSEFLSLGKPIVSKVFRTYTFLLIEDPIKVAYNRVLEVFGGAVVQVALDNLTLWKNMPTEPTTVVLVSEAHFQTISDLVMAAGTGKDAASLSTTHSDPVVSAYLELYNNYICMVPEENVHLALYRDDQQELNRKPTACYLQRAREEPTTRPSGSSTAAADAATTNGSAPRASTSAPRASASAGRASANASPDSTGTKTPDGERFTVRKKPPASASSGFKKPAPTNGKDSVGGGKADEDTATSEAAPEPAPPPPEPVVATPSNKPNPAAAAAAATASPAVAPAADADGNKGSNGAKPEMQVAEHEETAPAAGEAEPPLVTEAGGSANGEEDGGAADASDDAAEVEPRAPYAEATPAHPSERLPSKNTVSAAMRAVEAGVSRRSTVSEQRRLPVAAHPTASVAADKSPSPDYQEPYEGR